MIGQTISHYKILEKLGGGGMGVVYKAEDTRLRQFVALKFLPPELTRDEDAKERFIHEAQAAFALDHPNICNVHGLEETPDGQLFICMAYYEGETLKKKIADGPLPVGEAVKTVTEIADGLAEAHDHGVVHRDIKPANVMVTDRGGVKIVDFGLAKLKGAARITESGQTVGTPVYMSPEQVRGDQVDERSDVFSLGVVLYELLTGSLPFRGDYEPAVQFSIVNEPPEPLSKYRKDFPDGLQDLVAKALEKDPDRRYQRAADMRVDLGRVMAGGRKPTDFRFLLKLGLPVAVVLAVLVAMLLEPTAFQVVQRLLRIDRTPSAKHIVVLPFENIGGDAANQEFCDGLLEMLTSKLTQMEQFHGALSVVPSSEVRERKINSPSQARREFGVNLALTGSVQRFSELFQLTLNLIDVDANPPHQLDSKLFNDSLSHIWILQNETVVNMAAMLNVELQPKEQLVLFVGGTAVAASYDSYIRGRGYLRHYDSEEKLDRAVALFEQAIEEDSLYALAYARLGEAYWRKYNLTRDSQWVDRAVANCNRAYELNDMLAPVRVTLGMIHHGTGEYEKSVTEFEAALALDAANADAYRGLARSYRDLQMPDKAESAFKKAIELKPEYWAGYDDLGMFYYGRGRYDEAAAQFGRAVTLAPENGRVASHLGAAYYAQEQWDDARRMFIRSIEIEPTYSAYTNLGVIEYIEGRYAESASMLEKALDLNDTNYITWANLGNAYYWIPDRREEAFDVYRRTAGMAEKQRQVNPRDAYLLASLAGYYVILGEGARALPLLEEALAIAPDDWWVIYSHAHAYEQLGDREEALKWIEKALAAGYQRKEIERDPWMADLCADERFQQLFQSGVE